MKIHGKERKFELTVGATAKVAAMCPEHDLKNMDQFMTGDYVQTIDAVIKLAMYMNEAYELKLSYISDHEADPITYDELSTLSPDEMMQLQNEVVESFTNGVKTEIKTEVPKTKGKTSKKN